MRYWKFCVLGAFLMLLSCGVSAPARAGAVVNVRDFGAKGDGVTDDTAAVNAAIAAGVKNGPGTRVFLPAGKYLILKPSGGAHLHISHADGLTVGGQAGTEVLGDDPNASLIDMSDCTDTVIRNLTIAQDRYYFTQGTCVSMDHTAHTVNLKLDPGYPEVDDPHIVVFAHWTIHVVDSENTGRYNSDPAFTIAPTAIKKIGDRLWQLTFPDFRGYPYQSKDIDITGKKVLIWDDRRSSHGISGGRDRDCLIENVRYYGKGVNAGLILYDCTGTMTFRRFVIGTPPGSHGVLSCSGGGQLINIRGSLVYDHCDFQHFDDDGADIFTGMDRVLEQRGPRTLLVQGHSNYKAGDRIGIVDWGAKQERSHAQVVSVQYPDGGGTLVQLDQDVTVLHVGKGPDQPNLDTQLHDGIDRVTDFNLACASVTFNGCTFQCNRARPLNLKSQNTLIENCTFFNCSGAPIQAGPEMWWGEAPSIHTLTIRNNRFYSCDNEDIDLGVFYDKEDDCLALDNENILIEGNRFDQFSKKGALRIRNAKNVVIRNNWFGKPEAPLRPGKKVLNISHCESVTVSGNTGLQASLSGRGLM